MSTPDRLGGIIHTYQKFDPVNFPSPTAPPPDMVSPAMSGASSPGRSEGQRVRAVEWTGYAPDGTMTGVLTRMITYEERLNQDVWWALQEGSMHFEEASAVHRTLVKIARKLEELGIPYAIAGAMALFFHGYRRFTEDVDILVTRDGMQEVHRQLEGLGYLPPFQGSKNLRDTETGVRIEFLITGDFPGDGKPKPVAFPDPAQARMDISGLSFLSLPKLIELKLASGMTNPRRAKDLVDVQELIDVLQLPADFAGKLNPFVRDKFRELWAVVRNNPSNEEHP